MSKGISRTFVASKKEVAEEIIGFYSLTGGEIDKDSLPTEIAKSMPNKLPVVLLGRLAVSLACQGQGIGGLLLVDALRTCVRVSRQVGIAAILVDAKDEPAAAFYQHFGFLACPDTPLRLVMSIKTAQALWP